MREKERERERERERDRESLLIVSHRWQGRRRGRLRLPQAQGRAWGLSKHPKFGACS